MSPATDSTESRKPSFFRKALRRWEKFFDAMAFDFQHSLQVECADPGSLRVIYTAPAQALVLSEYERLIEFGDDTTSLVASVGMSRMGSVYLDLVAFLADAGCALEVATQGSTPGGIRVRALTQEMAESHRLALGAPSV